MKALKKVLIMALAVIMSLSLFACGGGEKELTLKPAGDDIPEIVNGSLPAETMGNRINPRLAYTEGNYNDGYKNEVREKLIELLGIKNIELNACDLNVKIEKTETIEANEWIGVTHKRIKFTFNSEYGATVPCFLLIPEDGKATHPLMITLHGHSRQGYLSATGQWIDSIDTPQGTIDYAKGSGAFAIQAIERGYAALAIEQRGMATRMSNLDEQKRNNLNASGVDKDCICDWSALNALGLGRTIIGERVWEVMKAIDALSDAEFASVASKFDLNDISITGSSGGGTAAFYAGCLDERIKLVAPNCAFCSFGDSLLYQGGDHCACNFIPGIYTWFDMGDLASLIAPRKLVVISGENDPGFLLDGAETAFETVEKIYTDAGVKDNCAMEIAWEKGHTWDEATVWNAIGDMRA